jgi:outer membrane cobalamin receptor
VNPRIPAARFVGYLPHMKQLLVLLAAAALLPGATAFATEPKPTEKPAEKKPAATEQKVKLTGSHLPQRVTKVGRITDSASPVAVYSRADIEATGATDLKSALRALSPSIR